MTFSLFIIIGILLFVGLFIFLVISMQHKNFLNLYLLLMSLSAILGLTISFGFLVGNIFEYQLISTEIYAQQQRTYRQCREKTQPAEPEGLNGMIVVVGNAPETEEAVEICEKEALLEVTERRIHTYQDHLIAQCTWLFVFTLLFVIHFPFFIKQQKKAEITTKKS
ncbi:MAG: hypothetical protein LBG59_01945 [Candidatus Peribacteria bacterium]|jgi:uncharacterized integral membrane protein|nr:hypothetical protein [Candidatus Peribacteria bacterium]